ncbi:MAG: nitrate reductase cytochrome c-type subunit [Pseudomonadota bacterium]
MKKSVTIFIVAVVAMFFTASAVADVQSLRGDELKNMSAKPSKKKIVSVEGGIERSFKEQPPMVPHTVDKYEINLKNNGCMKCHSEETYEKEKAPKVGDSHYIDRNGKVLDTLSSRRYFCSQCHATQFGAEPLVQNNFTGVK